MSDRDALLAAILANPDEDTPRLMFADWLKENGDSDRGEFVRLQVEAAHAEPFSPSARPLAADAQRLLERHAGEWTRHLAERTVARQFVRGFVEQVTVNAATFARDAAALFAAEPIRSLRVLRYAVPPVSLDAFFNAPQLAQVTRLDFSRFCPQPSEFDAFTTAFAAAQPRFDQITDLNLRENAVQPGWLRTLLAGGALPALAGLDLADDSHLGRVLAEALPTAAHRRFARLDLSYIRFASDQIQKVLASRCAREVEELRLAWRGGSAGPGPLTHLTLGWTIPWDRLRVLDLNGQGVGSEGVREIVAELSRRPGLAPLRWLGLADNGIGADGVRALAASDESRIKLYHLDLRNNGLTAAHRAALRERFPDAVIQS